MDRDIEIFRITDFALAFNTISEPQIAAAICEDDTNPRIPDVVNEFWIGANVDGKYIGCWRLHQVNMSTWWIHIFILPYARKQGLDLIVSDQVMEWYLHNVPGLNVIMAAIPVIYENVHKHIMAQGAVVIGKLPGSFLKGGEYHDMWVYADTRDNMLNNLEKRIEERKDK